MAFVWPVNAEGLFHERYPQILRTGLPAEDVDVVRAAITDFWLDAPGGWVYEWSSLGARYAAAGDHWRASLAYGWAKFPSAVDAPKRQALGKQLEEYLLAAPEFGVDFERRVLEVPHLGGTSSVPVHIMAAPGLPDDAPVLLASGGTDGWKMDLHSIFVLVAEKAPVRVVVFDIPGTGETTVPMTPDGGPELVRGLIAAARSLGNGTVIHLGISMGGQFSARTGLAGEVDAAIDFGGPVEESWKPRQLQFGMNGIVGNTLGFDHLPSSAEFAAATAPFDLRPLLDQDINAPMLVINGADDVHIPQHDTLVFRGRRDTEVHLIPDTGHCAMTKLPEALGIMFTWLHKTLARLESEASS